MGLPRWTVMQRFGKAIIRRRLHIQPEANAYHAQWLQNLLRDTSSAPSLYAWTVANLSLKPTRNVQPPEESSSKRVFEDEWRRIYILGVGNIGRLYAMCLAKPPDRPPITLVVHRKELLEQWVSQPGVQLTRGGATEENSEFDIELWTEMKPSFGPITEPAKGNGIRNLVVATKASDALLQVDRLRGYLRKDSTVAFTQNGMCKLWPPMGETYISARYPNGLSPNWTACVTTHGITSLGPFKSLHASPANALVGSVLPNTYDEAETQRSNYLVNQIANAPDLAAQQVSRTELWIAQLEKLVVNAVINPLTAVLRCKNGELFVAREDNLSTIIDALIDEASKILCALVIDPSSDEILLSEDQTAGRDKAQALGARREELVRRFSFIRLRETVLRVGAKVAENTSSMLQDARAGKTTEIDDFNGWLVETATYLSRQGKIPGCLKLTMHEKLIRLVKSRAVLTRREVCESLHRQDEN